MGTVRSILRLGCEKRSNIPLVSQRALAVFNLCSIIVGLLLANVPAMASAQIVATVTVQNDDRFRGRSTSNGEPVAIGSISIDDDSGFYAGGEVALTTNGPSFGILRGSAYAGIAKHVAPDVSVNGGVVLIAYSDRYSGANAQEFIEVFAGASWKNLALNTYYSPNYLDQGLATLYVEASASQRIADGLTVNGRAGLLSRLSGEGSLGGRDQRFDISLGVTKEFDLFSVSLTGNTAGPSEGTYFQGPWQGQNSVVVAISRSF